MGCFFSKSAAPNHAPGATTAEMARLERVRVEVERARERGERVARIQAEAAARAAAGAGARGYPSGSAIPLPQAQAPSNAALLQSELRRKEFEEKTKKLRELEETNRQKEEDKKKYPIPDFLKDALLSGNVNIAVAGQAGVGKSQFVNFVRGVKQDEAGYAPVGTNEKTMWPTDYVYKPSDPSDKVTLWDLPGVGTPNFPNEAYLARMGIRYFDCVVLLTSERFTVGEVMLKKEMDEKRVPYFCVRTRPDHAWEAKVSLEEERTGGSLTDERKQEVKKEVIKLIKDDFKEKFDIAPVYLIASFLKHKKAFDYDELHAAMKLAIVNARCEQDCPVCFDKYSDYGGSGAKKVEGKECGHAACEGCMTQMLLQSESPRCPVCRHEPLASSSAKRARVGA